MKYRYPQSLSFSKNSIFTCGDICYELHPSNTIVENAVFYLAKGYRKPFINLMLMEYLDLSKLASVKKDRIIVNCEKIRLVSNLLTEYGLLSESDKDNLKYYIKEVEEIHFLRAHFKNYIYLDQAKILKKNALPHINNVLLFSTSTKKSLEIIRFMCDIDSVDGSAVGTYSDSNEGLLTSKIYSSIRNFARIFNGYAEIEFTLKNQHPTIPDLPTQQKLLIQLIKKKFLEKFYNLVNEEKFSSLFYINSLLYNKHLPWKFNNNHLFSQNIEKISSQNKIRLVLITIRDGDFQLDNFTHHLKQRLAKYFIPAWMELQITGLMNSELSQNEINAGQKIYDYLHVYFREIESLFYYTMFKFKKVDPPENTTLPLRWLS